MDEYNIISAFQTIEDYLIDSMIRNMKRHRAKEIEEGLNYAQWQAEQLLALQQYRLNNKARFEGYTSTINGKIAVGIQKAHDLGEMETEIRILNAIKRGYRPKGLPAGDYAFFLKSERRLNEVINRTIADMTKAQYAMYRMADDQYRKVIFNSVVFMRTGAGNYEQCVDMATRDFLARGLNCIEYKDGRRVPIDAYSEMAVRTANARARAMGDATKRDEWEINTVRVKKRFEACPFCLKYTGKVFYDDVWGSVPVTDNKYPRLSEAMASGLYHPNCKDFHTTFFEGISRVAEELTDEQKTEAARVYNLEQKQRYMERNIRKFKRLEDGSLDPQNKLSYQKRRMALEKEYGKLVDSNDDVLKYRYDRLKTRGIPAIDLPYDLNNQANSGTIHINNAFESPHHPSEIVFGDRNLSKRQQDLLDMMPSYDSRITVRKRDVSMTDLAALTARTGDEFALFTRKGERLIIRGDSDIVPINLDKAILLKNDGYRFSGHTHPGISRVNTEPSGGDIEVLKIFGQKRSVIYNSVGSYKIYEI